MWDVHRQLRVLSDKEAAHLPTCDRCLVTLVICRLSNSYEEAERRLMEHEEV